MNDANYPIVSMNNTKKELLDAYAEVRSRVEEQRKELLNAEKARAAAEKKAAQVVAVQEAENDPVKRIHDLRGVLGKELLGLADRFECEVQTFEKVQSAVQQKKDELEALYGIEAQVEDLSTLIALHSEKKKTFEEREQLQLKTLQEEMAARRLQWEKEQKDADARLEDARAERKLKWKREQEEYDYALNREREQRRNQLEDELNAVSREIEVKQAEFDSACAAKQEELVRRETVVSEREKVMDDLQQKVDSFSAAVEKTVKAAVAENTEKLTAEFASRELLAAATHEGKNSVLQSRIDFLEKQVEMQLAQIEQLSAKQESAYQKVQDIASRAVDSARREYVSFAPSGSHRSTVEQ